MSLIFDLIIPIKENDTKEYTVPILHIKKSILILKIDWYHCKKMLSTYSIEKWNSTRFTEYGDKTFGVMIY